MALEPKSGRWGVSRIRLDARGGWTTAALEQGAALATSIQCFYPPFSNGAYALPLAAVRLTGVVGTPDADTSLFPTGALALSLGDLSAAQRTAFRSRLESVLTAYSFRDWDGAEVARAFSASGYTNRTTLREILIDVYRHLGHSDQRGRGSRSEFHNTEYTDGFATDPATRWTSHLQTYVWDSGNSELDVTHVGNPTALRYSANNSGSLAHESQVTTIVHAGAEPYAVGCAARMYGTGPEFYALTVNRAASELQFGKYVGGSFSTISTTAITVAAGDFVTMRLACEGAAGANVVLSAWFTNHGAVKPSNPGWIGVDGSPTATYTDSSADRLDDSVHTDCGIGGRTAINTDYDTRHCFFKLRAVSDRAGGGTTYNITPSGAVSSSGRVVKQANKIARGTGTSAGAVVRQAQKRILGAAASAGAVRKSPTKLISGAASSAGAVVRQASKACAGVAGSAGAVIRSVSKTVSGAAASAGALAKQAQKPLAGAVSSMAGTMVRTANKLATGVLASAGALARSASFKRTGTLDPAGSMARLASKSGQGTLSSAGEVVASSASGQMLSGMVEPSGELRKAASKTLAGGASSSGSVAKAISKSIAGGLSSAGLFSGIRAVLRSLSGEASSSGSLARQAQAARGGTLSSAGSVRKDGRKAVSGSASSSGGVRKLTSRAMAGAMASAGLVRRGFSRLYTGLLTASATLATVLSEAPLVRRLIGGRVRSLAQKAATVTGIRARRADVSDVEGGE